ncbi:4'-phosphopantetheinyl transferase family protein [Curvivirga aplysinae]|uniref:4'-phosphopantetheinyl transferase family protein n=1 Tax=Curvivirga aplysinae TaxID=2529852 RepID=UPI0012BD1B7A|nr:hypothetical protein [Curvivirga aplysinae]MTI11038.1 hypothetical protein [Curvivirga aplysinae]
MEEDFKYASHFKRTERQQQSLLGACMGKILASSFTETHPLDWKVLRKNRNIPILSSDKKNDPIYLSISHSQDQVLVAVSTKYNIGIDIEIMKPTRDIGRIIGMITPHISETLPKTMDELYVIWTQFESYYKVSGYAQLPALPRHINSHISSLVTKNNQISHIFWGSKKEHAHISLCLSTCSI